MILHHALAEVAEKATSAELMLFPAVYYTRPAQNGGSWDLWIRSLISQVFYIPAFFIRLSALRKPKPDSRAESAPTMQAMPISPNIIIPSMIPVIPRSINSIPISFMVVLLLFCTLYCRLAELLRVIPRFLTLSAWSG